MEVAIVLTLEALKTVTPSREMFQRVIADPPLAEHVTAKGDATVPLLIGFVHDKVTPASAHPNTNKHNAKANVFTNLNIATPYQAGRLSMTGTASRSSERQPIRLQWSMQSSGE
jgi:hypothetical protein